MGNAGEDIRLACPIPLFKSLGEVRSNNGEVDCCHVYGRLQTVIGLVTGFIEHLLIVTRGKHSDITNSYTHKFIELSLLRLLCIQKSLYGIGFKRLKTS
jgi:hypothetical protein